MAFPGFLRRRPDRERAMPNVSDSTDRALIGSTQIDERTVGNSATPTEVQTGKVLGVQVTTFQWDRSRDLVSLLEDLHTLSKEDGIAPDDLNKKKREILGIPEVVTIEALGPSKSATFGSSASG